MNDIAGEHALQLPAVSVERTRINPPGRSQLAYGGGAYLAVLDRMLIRLPRQVIPGPDGGPDLAPFARFNADSGDDWTVALLHAWAAVTDVLGFYHERIINEGYLRTATERLSVVQLARTVGYELHPGLAAGAVLALTVVQGLGEPPRTFFVPKGTAVQSLPSPKSGLHQGTPASSMPQVFETSDDFVARSDWNLLRPAASGELTGEHRILPGTNSLRLLGNRTDLRKGDRLLFIGQDPTHPQRKLWQMAQVKVTAPNAAGFTAVSWESVPGLPAGPLPLLGPDPEPDVEPLAIAAPQLFVLRQQAKLFTYTAAGVYRTWPSQGTAGEPDAGDVATSGSADGQAPAAAHDVQPQPAWWPAGIGLPHEPVDLLLSTRSGHLLGVTTKGIYRSNDGGATWQPAGAGLQARHITALTEGNDGTLYAGTDKGEVHLSQDEGETWRQAAGDPIHLPVRGLGKLAPAILRSTGHLPEVVVTSLAAYRSGGTDVLAAGADSGVFLSTNQGRQWKAANLVLPKLDRKTGMAKVSVQALGVVRAGKRQQLYAGTDEGVFPIRATSSATPVILAGLVLAVLYRLILNPGGILTRQVYTAVVNLTKAAGAAVAALLTRLNEIAGINLPPISDPLATPVAKLIGNVGKAILTPIAQLPATIPVPTATPASTASATATAMATATATPTAMAAVTVTPAATAAAASAPVAAALPKPIAAILAVLDQYPVLWFLVDAALIAAAIGIVMIAWWLIWRFLNNRPGRRIAGALPPAALPAAMPGKLPGVKDLIQQLTAQRPPVAVRDLKANLTGLYAGTAQGVYHAAGPGPGPQDKWLRRLGARLVQIAFPGLLAGWTRLETASQAQPDVQSLALPEPDSLLAATGAGATHHYRYVNNSWKPTEADGAPAALTGIAGTAALGKGLFLAGTPPKAKVDPAWSPWQLQEHAIHLDALPDGIAAGSWLVLDAAGGAQTDQPSPLPRLYQVRKTERADSSDASKKQPLTRVVVDRGDDLARYDRTTARALFQSEPLAIYDDRPVQGSILALDRVVTDLRPGQPVIISGKRMRARLIAPADPPVTLTTLNGLQTVPIRPGESLIVLRPPQRQAVTNQNASRTRGDAAQAPGPADQQPTAEIWRLRNRDGIEGEATIEAATDAAAPQFVIEPPHDDDPEVNELAALYDIAASADRTTLTLTTDLSAPDRTLRPLANMFERTTVTLRANIVQATHGSTVPLEVLGSSDGSQANQRFLLRQAPLTYISAATPEGRQSTLAVTVAGVRWRQAPFLYGHPRDERAYIVQHDEQGRATITFGDGRAGARLPSTREEVRATYRIGIGEAGNVPAGSLTQLRSAPPGLAGVTNPLPASGGVEPETNDSIRANVSLGLHAMHRIVSLSDYEDFVRSFAGIGRVQAKMFHRGHGGLLHLTVADADGNPLPLTSNLYLNLVTAVERARVAPTPRLRIDAYEPVFFDVALKVVVDHDFKARQATIEQQARLALSNAFTFQRRDFGQGVSASEIINLVQPIAGVVGVEITQLAYHGSSPTQPPPDTAQAVAAQPARWPQDAVLPAPAQLLLINSQNPKGIAIAVEFVP